MEPFPFTPSSLPSSLSGISRFKHFWRRCSSPCIPSSLTSYFLYFKYFQRRSPFPRPPPPLPLYPYSLLSGFVVLNIIRDGAPFPPFFLLYPHRPSFLSVVLRLSLCREESLSLHPFLFTLIVFPLRQYSNPFQWRAFERLMKATESTTWHQWYSLLRDSLCSL